MKQSLSLAVLGAVYALAAIIDAPLVFQAFAFCGNSLVSYEGMGWFAAGSAAIAAVLLGLACSRVIWLVPPRTPHRYGIESVTVAGRFEPGLILPIFPEVIPDLTGPFGLPLPDVASG